MQAVTIKDVLMNMCGCKPSIKHFARSDKLVLSIIQVCGQMKELIMQ